jgi:ABC-2 type transport system permease protein
MRKTLKITLREYKVAVRSKAFLIMIMLVPVFMGGSIAVTTLLENRKDTTDKRIAVVDRSGVIAAALQEAATKRNASELFDEETGKKVAPAYTIEIVPPSAEKPEAQRLRLSDRVRNKELHAFVEIGKDVVHPADDAQAARITYHAENSVFHDARKWIAQPINNHIRSLRLAEAGLDEASVSALTRWTSVEGLGLISVDENTGQVKEAERSDEGKAILLPLGLMMLLFTMIMVGSTPLVSAVLEEKMQRIAEVLLGSVRPFQLMLGKLLGTVAVSLTAVVIYISGAIAVAYYLDVADHIPFHILPWFAVYQIAAILTFGAMFTAIGSACNDLKEAQSMMMPAWLLVMIPMMIWMPVVKEPLGSLATWASLIPPCTPMLMLVRQASPAAIPAWQPWAGLFGIVVFTTLCVWAAGRIFRVGILMQGKQPKLTDLARWAIRG